MTEPSALPNSELIKILTELEQSICEQRKHNHILYTDLDQEREALLAFLQEREAFIGSIKSQGEHDIMAFRQAYSKIQIDYQAELKTLRQQWTGNLPPLTSSTD